MRKNSIAKQVKYCHSLLKLSVSDSGAFKQVNNWFQISEALYKLNEFSFVGDSVKKIFNLGPPYQSCCETISIPNGNYNVFLSLFNQLISKCEAIIEFSYEEDDESDLHIKLPDRLDDLVDLSNLIKDLDTSFNKCPLLSEKIGKVSFNKVEEGSNWLVVTIAAGSKVLEWIANYIKSCNEIRIQNRTIKEKNLDIILKKMKVTEEQQKQFKKNYDEAENEEIKSLCIKNFKKLNLSDNKINPEDENRIVHSMKTLSNLLDDGIEIYPSSSVEDDIKNIFPNKEETKLLEEPQKLLDDSNSIK